MNFWYFAALSLLIASASPARATLGRDLSSVEHTRRAFAGVRLQTVDRSGFSVHEIATGGISVREYVGPDGQVFGVGWNGPVQPDLEPILGDYAADLRAAVRTNRAEREFVPVRIRHAQSVLRGDRLTLEKYGRPGRQGGRAYLPARIPAGVRVDAIR